MKRSLIITLSIVGFLFILIIWGIRMYNNLVTLDEAIPAQWAQVDNAYNRRADLIPNLVATVKGYAEHESSTLTAVIEARSKATQITVDPENLTPEKLQQYQQAQGQLSSALGKLLMITENYPDLKANQNFLDLQTQLESTENRIATERGRFNDSVKSFNSKIRTFPANLFGFEKHAYFEATEAEPANPKVKF